MSSTPQTPQPFGTRHPPAAKSGPHDLQSRVVLKTSVPPTYEPGCSGALDRKTLTQHWSPAAFEVPVRAQAHSKQETDIYAMAGSNVRWGIEANKITFEVAVAILAGCDCNMPKMEVRVAQCAPRAIAHGKAAGVGAG